MTLHTGFEKVCNCVMSVHRKRTGMGGLIGVRFQLPEMSSLDRWIAVQSDHPSRPEAIRRLVRQALASADESRPTSKGAARKASELAAREIEGLADKSQSPAEQQRRERRLIRGPKEFRDMRGDQPKPKTRNQ